VRLRSGRLTALFPWLRPAKALEGPLRVSRVASLQGWQRGDPGPLTAFDRLKDGAFTGVEDGRSRFTAGYRTGERGQPDLTSFRPSHLDVRIAQVHSLRVPTNMRSAHVECGRPTCRRLVGTRGASRHAFVGTPLDGNPSQPSRGYRKH